MRIPKYLSPTAIMEWGDPLDLEARKAFYLKRLAEHRPPGIDQTKPMSVGSAFDAFIKSYLHKMVYGNYGKNNEFDLNTIFESQVDPINRDFALKAGQNCFNQYKHSGAIADLMIEIGLATEDPRFEFTILDAVKDPDDINDVGIPLLGKPDLSFMVNNRRFTYDWKVNGYCSHRTMSPKKGYNKCRDGWTGKPSRGGPVQMHKDCIQKMYNGIMINTAIPFEAVDFKWALQTTVYNWILGSPVGVPTVIGIEQLACKDNGQYIRCASHRGMTSEMFQKNIFTKVSSIWHSIQNNHIFDWMTKVESIALCNNLDLVYKNDGSPEAIERDKWFSDMTRNSRPY